MPFNDPDHEVVAGVDPQGDAARLAVDDSGRIITTTSTVSAPGFTDVKQSLTGDLAGNTSEDDEYLIPDTKLLKVQSFAAGAESGAAGSSNTKMELFHDPAGTGSGMTLLRVAFLSGSNAEFQLGISFTGDGVAKIRLRRTSLDAGTRECAVFWEGSVEQ